MVPHFYRWLRSFDINTASQQKLRNVANEWAGNDLITEDAPFTFLKSKNVYEIRQAPWSYLADLPLNVLNHMDKLEE